MKDRYQMKKPNIFESLKISYLFTYLTAHNFSLAGLLRCQTSFPSLLCQQLTLNAT